MDFDDQTESLEGGFMEKEKRDEKPKKKGFFENLIEKLDKKMEEKSKSKPCCGGDDKRGSDASSCCK